MMALGQNLKTVCYSWDIIYKYIKYVRVMSEDSTLRVKIGGNALVNKVTCY